MKIAFSGSSGTGKTTTAQALGSHRSLSGTPVINTDARLIMKSLGLYNIQSLNHRDYKLFQLIYLRTKLKMEAHLSAFLTERSSIDCLAYWNLNCRAHCHPAVNRLYENLCVMNARRYDLIVYFPWGSIPFQDDGWRGTDPDFHSRVDLEARHLYEIFSIEKHILSSADLHARCAEIIENLPHE